MVDGGGAHALAPSPHLAADPPVRKDRLPSCRQCGQQTALGAAGGCSSGWPQLQEPPHQATPLPLPGHSQQQGAVECPECLTAWPSLRRACLTVQCPALSNPAFTILCISWRKIFLKTKLVMSRECGAKISCSEGPEEEEIAEG